MLERRIIKPDNWYENTFDYELLKNPLTQADWLISIDDPLFEVASLSFYSLGWAAKYLLNTELAPFQTAFLHMLFNYRYPLLLASRGSSKTFTLAVYSVLRALLTQGSKVVIVSSTFRQAKHVFNEIEAIYKRAPLLRACVNHKPHLSVDHCLFRVGESTIKALPMGNGDNIRGERASHIIVDEIDSVDPEIFNVVVRGFAATQLAPMDKMKEAAKRKKQNIVTERNNEGNQIIVGGTAGFTEGNFHKLYTQYERIIDNKVLGWGYDQKVIEALGRDLGEVWLDYRDYARIKLPWYFVPEGMLDRDMIASARMTMSDMLFDMEYSCEFADTSKGFFKAQDLAKATSKGENAFFPEICGHAGAEYAMGIDPARTSDAFAICIIKLGNPKKLIYCFAESGKPFTEMARKVLFLLDKFNVVRIGMDIGGGGHAVMDFLCDPQMIGGSLPILQHDAENKSKPGRYILQMITFAPKWIEESNFLLQKDIEDCRLMFASSALFGRVLKGEELAEFEILQEEMEKCKKELVQISVTQTSTGLRHFDIKPTLEDKKKKLRPRKDRYSALLIANAIANEIADYKNPLKNAYKNWANAHTWGGWVEEFRD